MAKINIRRHCTNKLVVIIGGSEGIGLTIAEEFALSGAKVVIGSRNTEKRLAAVASLRNRLPHNAVVDHAHTDVSDENSIREFRNMVENKYGAPFILVNSAGLSRPSYFEQASVEEMQAMLTVNCLGAILVCKEFVPSMVNQRESSFVINTASILGFAGMFGFSTYAASKHAVVGFSESLQSEFQAKGLFGLSSITSQDLLALLLYLQI